MQTFIPGRQQFPRLGGDVQLELQHTHSQLDQRLVSYKILTQTAMQILALTFMMPSLLYTSILHENQLTMCQQPRQCQLMKPRQQSKRSDVLL